MLTPTAVLGQQIQPPSESGVTPPLAGGTPGVSPTTTESNNLPDDLAALRELFDDPVLGPTAQRKAITVLESQKAEAIQDRQRAAQRRKEAEDDARRKAGEFEPLLRDREAELQSVTRERDDYKEKWEKSQGELNRVEKSRKETILAALSEEDRKAFGHLSSVELEVLAKRLAPATPIEPRQSQHGQRPASGGTSDNWRDLPPAEQIKRGLGA